MSYPDNGGNAGDRLPWHLAVAFTLLLVYASLHPFIGWRDLGAPPLAWLGAGWPHYYTGFDMVSNVAIYLPLGFLWLTVFHGDSDLRWRVLAVTLAGALLSAAVETTQNYLPTRVPSNIDLACNAVGTLTGALLGASWGRAFLSGGRLHSLRVRLIVAGGAGDTGLVLMGLWLLTQLNPESLLFGNGDLRRMLGIAPTLPFDIQRFSRIEAVIAAVNTLAVGLIIVALQRHSRWPVLLGVLLLGVLVRGLATAVLVDPRAALHLLTVGNASGFAIGIVLLLFCAHLWPPLRRGLCACSLLLATVLVNLAPQNPYLAEAAQVWR